MRAAFDSLLKILREPRRPVRYLAVCLLLDLPLTALVSWLVTRATGAADPTFAGASWWRVFFVMCVFVPLVETAILAAVIELARRAVRSVAGIALLCAALAAAAHSLATPLWGPIIAWAFFLQAICYQTWRQRSLGAAFGLTAALHALHNAYPALLLALDRWGETQP